ncbi:MAG: hypothetical protein IKX14_04560, partial [Neisseriaceae bacterium]|nr:hypothetical protein [Neisseriaceae bacterium]
MCRSWWLNVRNLSPESLPSDHLPDGVERTAYRDITANAATGTPVQETDVEKTAGNQTDKNGSGSLKDEKQAEQSENTQNVSEQLKNVAFDNENNELGVRLSQEEIDKARAEQEEKARLEAEEAERERKRIEDENKKKSLINHETKIGVSLKSDDYEINNLKDKNGKVSFNGFGKGIEKSIDEASKKYNVPKDY